MARSGGVFLLSASPSESLSPSSSASPSLSPSTSVSPSLSPSSSVSPSPSTGWEQYTRGNYAALPSGTTDLETSYSEQDYLDVDTNNDVRVNQSSVAEYAIHQFKDYVGAAASCTLTWEGQTNQACTWSPVVLQIYNLNTPGWETVDSDSTTDADTDFTLTANIPDLTNYVEANGTITCRVYQLNV